MSMRFRERFYWCFLIACLFWTGGKQAAAHPLGNFSVNHYARFSAAPGGAGITYVLDLAEIPTFELFREWNLDRTSPRAQLEERAARQMEDWLSHLAITSGDASLRPRLIRTELFIADGAGNLPIVRITGHAVLDKASGSITYEDRNYPGRAGWKEIVIGSSRGAHLINASQDAQDRSHALAAYPPDPTAAPPQDLRANFSWRPDAPAVVALSAKTPAAPAIQPIAQPLTRTAPSPGALARNPPSGTVVRNDFLSRLLRRQEIPFGAALLALLAAFGLGAAHALTPGHGKTIVAAYLVGSRGTLKHAAFLGAMVTFTHTISVFALGLVTLFLFRFVMPERITEILGVISGLSIVAIGAWMLWKRLRGTRGHTHHHGHSHDHGHGHDHAHAHVHSHDHSHGHTHDHQHSHPHDHSHAHTHGDGSHHHHGPGGHSHVPEGDITWGSLLALAVSGGLVPCESALVLLLGAVALGRVALGLLLLLSFSLGLSAVLMGIGALVLYAKHLLPERRGGHGNPWLRWLPVASAAVVLVVGVLMTSVSIGWLHPAWLIT